MFVHVDLKFCPSSQNRYNIDRTQDIMIVRNKAVRGFALTHWGRVTHICVIKLTIIDSDNGLLPGRRQAIIWTNDGILLIGRLGTNFREILIVIQHFHSRKYTWKCCSEMGSILSQPQCVNCMVVTKLSDRVLLVFHVSPSIILLHVRGKCIRLKNICVPQNLWYKTHLSWQ